MVASDEPEGAPSGDGVGMFRSLVQNAPDALMVVGDDLTVRYANPSVERMLGRSAEELEGTKVSEYLDPSALDATRQDEDPPLQFRLRHADGSWRCLEAESADLLEDPEVRGRAYYVRDITGRKAAEAELVHRAFHDPLTGLANRSLFMDRLAHALAASSRRGGPVTVLFLDLDDFKAINDGFGHGVGDLLLTMVAQRLRACLRPADTVARFGGDEFAVLLEDIASARGAAGVANRIAEVLREPISWEGHTLFATASVGVATSGPGLDTPEALLRAADSAMYEAKERGKARHEVFEEGMNAEILGSLRLEDDLRIAVERGELEVHYQPEVLLETGRLFGLEALLRWRHPRRGFVSPLEFVPLAEENGLIVPIGRWVLREACRQAKEWHERRPDAPPAVSVNLSARQFRQPGLVETVSAILEETGLSPEGLVLEITESLLVEETERTAEVLRRLKALGVRVAIDDFGTGYSALSYVERFPLDLLKIDRSFVHGLRSDDGEPTVLVPLLVDLAQKLGATAVAEGVETAEQLERLRAMGCDVGQGWYFSEPLPERAAAEFVGAGQAR